MRRTLVSGLVLAAVAGCTVVNPRPPLDDKISQAKPAITAPAATVAANPAGTTGAVRTSNTVAAATGLPSATTAPTPPATPAPVAVKPPATTQSAYTEMQLLPPPSGTTQVAFNGPVPKTLPPLDPTPAKPAGFYPNTPDPVGPGSSADVHSDGMSAQTLPPLPPLTPSPVHDTKPAPLPTSLISEHPIVQEAPPAMVSAPAMRMVNSMRFTLNYEVKDSIGVAPTVDLWCTRDLRSWKKFDAQPQGTHGYVVEVKEEGTYGFTLVARTGPTGSRPPQPGDHPQVWVSVDVTKPTMQVTGVELSLTAKLPTMIVHWTAQDKNFGPRPVTLSYAGQPEGPWTLIAQNVENNGHYEWAIAPNMPPLLYVRVEAADLVGNLGTAQTVNPIRIDSNWATGLAPLTPLVEAPKSAPLAAPMRLPVEPVIPAASIVNVEVSAMPSPKE